MKAKIGKYVDWVGPYQIANALFFWLEEHKWALDDAKDADRWDYKLRDKTGDWLASTWVAPVCQWIYDKRKRTIDVHVDNHDVWNMFVTVAHINIPLLKKLKETKHGHPYTYHEDAPWYFRFEEKSEYQITGEDGSYSAERWNWILDEIIWAFEQLANDDWESAYHHGNIDFVFNDNEDKTLVETNYGSNHTHWFDNEGYKKHNDAIDNGLRLYGKYLRAMWD